MRGKRSSRAARRAVRREHRGRRRARHLTLVGPPGPRRRPGRFAKPLVVAILCALAAVIWNGLPPPPPSKDRAPAVYFDDR